jgi:hypothetical protein
LVKQGKRIISSPNKSASSADLTTWAYKENPLSPKDSFEKDEYTILISKQASHDLARTKVFMLS